MLFKYLLVGVCLLAGSALRATPDGAALFEDKKCVKCHTVDAYEIASTSKKDPSEITDLSNAGEDFDSVDAIKAYMLRETEFKGKKHKTKFRGDDSELEALAAWILSLKSS